jgi:chromosome segregation ATPase
MLTLESVVGQLDRLFDDVKNVVDALEVNVMDNLAIINDNVNIIKESVDKSVERITALEESESEIHEIKEIVSYRYEEDNSSTNSSAIASQLEKQNELIATMLDGMQKMQQRMDEMNESITSLKSENAELKKTVEKIFESTDENASSFESIKNVIAELKEDVGAIEENVSDSDDDLDVILDKIDEAIADKNE